MFNSIAFDVFIGLILIYLLYSLLITILGEMLATWMGIRSRLLRVAIEKMLNDGYFDDNGNPIYNKRVNLISRFFLKEYPEFEHSFAGTFYRHPNIKYLANGAGEKRFFFTETKPAYFSSATFADTLVQLLREKGKGADDMARINLCLQFNTYHIQPETLKKLQEMAESSDNNLATFTCKLENWYHETMDRTSGWYKKKLQVLLFTLGLVIAALFNIDTIQIAQTLTKDKTARAQMVTMAMELAKDSARYKAYVDKNGAPLAQSTIDSGWNSVNKDIRDAHYILGLGWHPDTLTRTSVRKAEVRFYRPLTDTLQLVVRAQNQVQLLRDSLLNTTGDSARTALRYKLAIQKDSLQLYLKQVNRMADADFVQISHWLYSTTSGNQKVMKITGRTAYTSTQKWLYVLVHLLPVKLSFWGLVLTALMLSLGAPFWFDLLKKLVAIRGSGVKPEEKTEPAKVVIKTDGEPPANGAVIVAPLPPAANAEEEALRLYGDVIQAMPGVKSVFKVYDKVQKQHFIQINTDGTRTQLDIQAKFPVLQVGSVNIVPVVKVTGSPRSQQGGRGVISNKSGRNGQGTLACILERKDTGSKHLLSCWHVMKGNTRYSERDDETTILDHDGNEFADRWCGGIYNELDYAIARCRPGVATTFNNFLSTQLNINGNITVKEISRQDIDDQIAVKYFDSLNRAVQNGIIYSDSAAVEVHYMDQVRTVKDVLILTSNAELTISGPGNSGSLVFDAGNHAIAMIISSDLHYTYAIKLTHIFQLHQEMKMA